MSNETIKRCPCCNGMARLIQRGALHFVQCACGIRTGSMWEIETAVAMWNRRDGEPDLLVACEKLVAYRDRAGAGNFQLEKADDFIHMMRAAIARAKGETGGDAP